MFETLIGSFETTGRLLEDNIERVEGDKNFCVALARAFIAELCDQFESMKPHMKGDESKKLAQLTDRSETILDAAEHAALVLYKKF